MSPKTDPDTLPDELTITLRQPIVFPPGPNGETYTHLSLKEPTAGQMMKVASLSGTEEIVHLVFYITGMPIDAVKMLGIRDIRKIEHFFSGFFAPPAGEAG